MALVILAKTWTDPAGVTHPAGSPVEVDDITAARLREDGYDRNAPGGKPPSKPDEFNGPG